eukprot:gene503-273_t
MMSGIHVSEGEANPSLPAATPLTEYRERASHRARLRWREAGLLLYTRVTSSERRLPRTTHTTTPFRPHVPVERPVVSRHDLHGR